MIARNRAIVSAVGGVKSARPQPSPREAYFDAPKR